MNDQTIEPKKATPMSTNRNSAAANEVQVARESVDDALMIVESYGPWGADLNDAHRRQVVLADEVKRLRHLYEMAVRGRAEMRAALRQERRVMWLLRKGNRCS